MIEPEREEDGRWLASVPELPGVMAYGETEREAVRKTKAVALQVLATLSPRQVLPYGGQELHNRAGASNL